VKKKSAKADGGCSGGETNLDPNLTNPIVLNAAINATLLQPPQPWFTTFIPLISAAIAVLGTVLGYYLGHRLQRSAEKERDFKMSRKRAYYEYISTFSDQSVRNANWTPDSISTTLPIFLNTALEAGEYGDVESNVYFKCRFDLFREIGKSKGSHPWIGLAHLNAAAISNLHIASLRNFILLLEFLLLIDPNSINKEEMNEVIKVGQSYFQLLMNKLWEEERPWWQTSKWTIIKRYWKKE